jgi:Tfp pilus assembly protein PilO
MDKLKEIIPKVLLPLFVLGLAYLGWDYYDFMMGVNSPLVEKSARIKAMSEENVRIREKIKQANEFYSTLKRKRVELRALATQLDEMKTSLSDDLDVPNLIKMVVAEATKVGLKVMSLKPTTIKTSEYYAEQSFDLMFHGAFAQLVLFLQRVSNLERIIRVDNFDIRRNGPSNSLFVEINGTVQLKAYKYLGSKADEIAKSGGSDVKAASTTGGPTPPGGGK